MSSPAPIRFPTAAETRACVTSAFDHLYTDHDCPHLPKELQNIMLEYLEPTALDRFHPERTDKESVELRGWFRREHFFGMIPSPDAQNLHKRARLLAGKLGQVWANSLDVEASARLAHLRILGQVRAQNETAAHH